MSHMTGNLSSSPSFVSPLIAADFPTLRKSRRESLLFSLSGDHDLPLSTLHNTGYIRK